MQKPQLEDGFTRIANELFEAVLVYGFTQRQLVVWLAILRKTYGYGKKEDDMSASQIGLLCNIKRNHVTETIGQLAKMGAITKRQGVYGLILGVNKDYKKWSKTEPVGSPDLGLVPNQDSPNSGLAKVVPIRDATSPNSGQVDSPKSGHTKENLSKETKQKKSPAREILFDEWLDQCKSDGVKPIPEDHAVFAYAEKIDLPIDFVRLCWLEFKSRFSGESKKKYTDWGAAFGNYVRKNYFRLWFEKEDSWHLTTAGIQLQKEMRGA